MQKNQKYLHIQAVPFNFQSTSISRTTRDTKRLLNEAKYEEYQLQRKFFCKIDLIYEQKVVFFIFVYCMYISRLFMKTS